MPSVSAEVSQIIHSNPITNFMQHLYDNFLAPQICILVSFINLCYAFIKLQKNYKSHKITKKMLCIYCAYAIFSLATLVIHCISFHCILGSLLAG